MLYPTLSIIVLAAAILSILMAGNWFAWGFTSTRNGRLPKLLRPVDGGRRLHEIDGDEFKRVA